MPERRIILIGKTGNGKSATGNSILGYQAFANGLGLCSVTQRCEICTGTNPINGRTNRVCDTPGLLDTDVSLLDTLLEVQTSVETCGKPHAFLLVFSSSTRFTKDEQHTIDLIMIMFGEKVFDHCIIVFARGNEFKTDTDFEIFLKTSELLVKLLEKCGGRAVRIETNNSDDGPNLQGDIHRLLEMIERVSDDGKKVYRYLWIDSHKKVLKKYAEEHQDKEDDIGTHLSNISEILGKRLSDDIWKDGLTHGVATACGGIAVLGAGAGAFMAGTYGVAAVDVVTTQNIVFGTAAMLAAGVRSIFGM